MPGGGLLKDLFGYWPTMRDARVRTIEFDPAGDKLMVTLDYTDKPTDAIAEISARIVLTWGGVKSVELDLLSDDLTEMEFRRDGGTIETFMIFAGEARGRIVSESVDATLNRLDPERPDETPMRLVYHRRA